MSTQDTGYSETTFNPGQKTCKLKVTFTASSVVSASKGRAATAAKTVTGTIRVTFNKKWNALAGFSSGWFTATGAALAPVIVTDALKASGYIDVELRASTGTPTDPASGDILFLNFTLDTLGLGFP